MDFSKTWFERAVFLSWYCSRGDCSFCYMSTQKDLIKDPKLARRSFESVIAEVIITKACGWKVEFLSGGYESYSQDELLFLINTTHQITGEKLWLNLGVLSREDIEQFLPHIQGLCGTVETVNPRIHDKVCPSKPISEVETMFSLCDEFGLKKAITIILGLGENLDDFDNLKSFVEKHKVDKITFYRLKPQKGTAFERSAPITSGYYCSWIERTRAGFPNIDITVGSWLDHLHELHLLLESGANGITKFPAIKQFNSEHARTIENEAQMAGRQFIGTLTKHPEINIEEELDELMIYEDLKDKIKIKLNEYLEKMN